MPNPYFCHFCGRSDSLHTLPNTNSQVCSKCWEIIAYIASKWYEAGKNLFVIGEEEKSDV